MYCTWELALCNAEHRRYSRSNHFISPPTSNLTFDHLSLSSVAAAAKSFASSESHLHGLITNAGILATPFALTFDALFQTNYLAHWAPYTSPPPHPPLDRVRTKPGDVRIANISATAHSIGTSPGGIDFEDINQLKGTSFSRYSQSKLANLLHAKTLHFLYGPDSPSTIAGNGEIRSAAVLLRMRGKILDADEGSYTQLYVTASRDLGREMSGRYFDNWKEKMPSKQAMDQGLGGKFKWTEEKMIFGVWIS